MSDLGDAPIGLPLINEPAPDFRANSTHGEISLADYRDKWVVLFSHPADFTPVCTTEFVAFAEMHEAFEKEEIELIGLSVDSVYAHIAWVRDIEEKFGVKISFPIIADFDMRVSTIYGMVHAGMPSVTTVRATFVIDPDGLVRAIIYYPLTVGRSMDEILRLVRALKVVTEHQVSVPANWQPGDAVILPTPVTQPEADKRITHGEKDAEVRGWYFATKKL